MAGISRELIAKALDLDVIKIVNGMETENKLNSLGIVAVIGESAVKFVEDGDDDLSLEEYWDSYTMADTAEMLYNVLKDGDSAKRAGIDSIDFTYIELYITDELDRLKPTLIDKVSLPLNRKEAEVLNKALSYTIEFMGYNNDMSDIYKRMRDEVTQALSLCDSITIEFIGGEVECLQNAVMRYSKYAGADTKTVMTCESVAQSIRTRKERVAL